MLPALTLLRRPHWPTQHLAERSPFTRGPNERPLLLIVDDVGMPASPAIDAILHLAHHEMVEVVTTSTHGPGVLRFDAQIRGDDQWLYTIQQPTWISQRSVSHAGTWLTWARESARRGGRDLASEERRYLLAGAADLHVDALVIADPAFDGFGGRSNAMTPTEAAAFLGLFLRSRDQGEVYIANPVRRTSSIGTQRFVVARSVLWAGWRWWSACVAASDDSGRVGGGLQLRFERAMRARDEVMIDCLQDTRGRGIDREILYHFDAMLIWLGSALDSTAHIANRAHQLGLHNHLVGWRRDPFRRALAVKAPRLHAITETGTPLRAVIDLIAAFRNTVHGEPLSGITYSSGGGEERGLVQLPTDAEAQATAATAPLGGRDLWGFVREGDAIVPGIWDPFVFVQVLLPFAAGALNALMETTDVEALPGVDAAKLRRNAPSNGFFEPDEVRKFALLHGLSAQVAIANG